MSGNERETLYEIVKGFRTTMLVTHEDSGQFRSRPMAIADIDDRGIVWLVSSEQSGKVAEIRHDDHVALVFQDDVRRYVSLTGRARISKDRAKLHAVWQEQFQVWFPDGPDSAEVCLLGVEPTEGEYWDARGGKWVQYLYEAVKARILGTKPSINDEEQYGRVVL